MPTMGEYAARKNAEIAALRKQLETTQLEALRMKTFFHSLNTMIAHRGAAALPEIALLIHTEIK